jgi:pentatricopeptide repeat protein
MCCCYSMFCRHRAIDRAVALLEEMKSKNIKPTQRVRRSYHHTKPQSHNDLLVMLMLI